MTVHPYRTRRRGAVLPLVAICMVAFVAMLALAIDVGMLTLARSEAQDLADATAMAAMRTVNGQGPGYNMAAVPGNVGAVVSDTRILGTAVDPADVDIAYGQYHYDPTDKRFEGDSTAYSGAPTFVRSTVRHDGQHFFGRALGMTGYSLSADAAAVHRPRDVTILMDFSVSMRFGSMTGGYRVASNQDVASSQSSDPVVPRFGHYTTAGGNDPYLIARGPFVRDDTAEVFGISNLTADSGGGPPIVEDFRTGRYDTTPAFAAVADPDGDLSTPVAGDEPLRTGDDAPGADYATSLRGVVGAAVADDGNAMASILRTIVWETYGYEDPLLGNRSGSFAGYTRGPGYWGKTFFAWPPDPRHKITQEEAKAYLKYMYPPDWNDDSNGPTSRNFKGIWENWGSLTQADMYSRLVDIHLSPRGLGVLRGVDDGRTKFQAASYEYYVLMKLWALGHDPAEAAPRDWRRRFFTFPDAGANPRDVARKLYKGNGHWERQADNRYRLNYNEVLNWIRTSGANPFPSSLRCGRLLYYTLIPDTVPASGGDKNQQFWRDYIDHVLGVDGNEGGDDVNSPSRTGFGRDFVWGAPAMGDRPETFAVGFDDNPRRPKLHFWFGPLTMLDFIQRKYGLPGACHEAQLWQCKVGVQSALRDIELNHPNDHLGLIFFSSGDSFTRPVAPLGQNYRRMKDALWYPADTLDDRSEKWAHDMTGAKVPRATGGTCPAKGFMLAYNQFSSRQSLINDQSPPGTRGGLGRRGAQKMAVFMTDGYPTQKRTGTLVGSTASEGYYSADSGSGSNGVDDAIDVITRMTALESDGGFATPARPVRLHTIGFGDLFEPAFWTSRSQASMDFLLEAQQLGGTSASGDTAIPDYKVITGPYATRIADLRNALTRIMQDGVQVALIE